MSGKKRGLTSAVRRAVFPQSSSSVQRAGGSAVNAASSADRSPLKAALQEARSVSASSKRGRDERALRKRRTYRCSGR